MLRLRARPEPILLMVACGAAGDDVLRWRVHRRNRRQRRLPLPVRMVAVEGEGAKYWPRWRGPSGQGVATGSGYPDTWSDTQNVLWRTRVPGRGHSSPIVWADRIFLTTAHDDGRVALLAFRRADGRFLWEAVGPDRTPERIHQKNSHASATPTTDGTLVFASFGNKGVMAVDFDGRIVWHRSLGSLRQLPRHGGLAASLS